MNNHDYLSYLVEAQFRIKTLEEARDLAFHLSYLCPEPNRIAIGLTELFINAIEHGNLGISFEQKKQLNSEAAWLSEITQRLALAEHQHKTVLIKVSKYKTQVQFQIEDQGDGFVWQDFLSSPPRRETIKHGRGILLAKHLSFDSLQYNKIGNCVTCIIYI